MKIFPYADFSPYEKWILYNFAVLPSIFISYRDNEYGLNLIDFLQVPEDKQLLDFPEAVQKLVRFGWIKRYNYGFNMHNLIQEVILSIEGRHLEHCEDVMTYLNLQLDHASAHNRHSGLNYVPYAQNIFDIFEASPSRNLGILYNNVGVTYEDTIGDYRKSLELSLVSLKIKEAVQDEQGLASAYNNIATTYRYLGNYELALEYAGKALEMRKKIYGEVHEYTGNTYQTISIIYRRLNRLEEAVSTCLKAIEIRKEICADEKSDQRLARLYNNIAIIYRDMNALEKSIEYALKSVEIKEAYYSSDVTSLAVSYNSLSVAYRYLKDFEQALHFAEKDLNILKSFYDKHPHPDFATTYNNLALIYLALEQHETALMYNDLELEILGKNYEETHPEFTEALQTREKIMQQMK